MIYFFDFDGTLVDVWTRFYEVFQSLTNAKELSQETYVRLKKENSADGKVAEMVGVSLPEDYFKEKARLLEDLTFLKKDTLLLEQDVLLDFFRKEDSYILTRRRNKAHFLKQLEYLGLEELKERSFVLNPDESLSKKEFILKKYESLPKIIIGDGKTEAEISTVSNTEVYLVDTGLFEVRTFPYDCKYVKDIQTFLENI